jgi:hypothetical protein
MASKIKVDQIQTADGTGTIALQNQLSGMTTASLPALGSAQMPTGSVLQVVQERNQTSSSVSAQGLTAVGGTGTITPSSTSSKILVTITGSVRYAHPDGGMAAMTRDIAGAGYSRIETFTRHLGYTSLATVVNIQSEISFTYLDSPNTTSACNYKLELSRWSGGAVTWLPSAGNEDHQIITMIEIAG